MQIIMKLADLLMKRQTFLSVENTEYIPKYF